MRIVKIEKLKNGGHANLTSKAFSGIPDGWAVIPDDMDTPNFPFGDVEIEEIDGVMTVIKWIPGIVPEHKETEKPISDIERLRADIDFVAAMTGVEL
jgi:hypothetical protein